MNQKQAMLEYLKAYGSIDSLTAIKEIGTIRPASIISTLRKDYIITTNMVQGKNRYGGKCFYAEYRYHGEKQKG